MNTPPKSVPPPIGSVPRLQWDEDGRPHAIDFGDGYFGHANALHEVAHVFLNGTDLWARFVNNPRDGVFHIGETGFGTGLNFCAAVSLWAACRAHGVGPARLCFTSVEAWPMAREDLARALQGFPALAPIADELIAQWPEQFEGGTVFEASFMNGAVRLCIAIDEAAKGFGRLTVPGGVNAWFLDGFAPSQNPEMWSVDLTQELNRLSAPGAVLASFTSAGFVRRNLEEAGFDVRRVKGFGRKRHMIKATFQKRKIRPQAPKWPVAVVGTNIAIIGGGIAGALAAHALRGYAPDIQITVFDDPAHAPNHPPYASVVPRLDIGGGVHEWIMPRLFEYAAQFWSGLGEGVFHQMGGVQTARYEKEVPRLHEAAQKHGGTILDDGRVLWPKAGYVESDKAIALLLSGAGVSLRRQQASVDLLAGEFDHVILAAGNGVGRFLPELVMPAQARGGVACKLSDVEMSPHSLFGKGHILPLADGAAWTGSSFHDGPLMAGEPSVQILQAGQEESVAKTQHLLELDGAAAQPLSVQENWWGERVVLPDQLPAFGPLPNWAQFAQAIAGLRHGQWLPEDKMAASFETGPRFHVLAGLGARGFMWGPMLANLLAKSLLGHTLPVPEQVAQLFAPWRFLLREERYSRLSGPDLVPNSAVSMPVS